MRTSAPLLTVFFVASALGGSASPTTKIFDDKFTVISCDVRGEGLKTEFPPDPFSMSDLADDCAIVVIKRTA